MKLKDIWELAVGRHIRAGRVTVIDDQYQSQPG